MNGGARNIFFRTVQNSRPGFQIRFIRSVYSDLVNETFSSAERVSLRQEQHRATEAAVQARVGDQTRSGDGRDGRPVEALRPADEVRHVDAQVVPRSTSASRVLGLAASEVLPVRPRALVGRRPDEPRMVALLRVVD